MNCKTYSIADIKQLAVNALVAHNTGKENATQVANALIAAEIDGLGGHGLARLPSYCAQSASGKVNGHALPLSSHVALSAVKVDAQHGFAYPALELAINELCKITPESGIAVAAVNNSHHCGAAGYHVEKLANKGFVGLLFANTPKAIAPWGGHKGLFGTNPIAFSVPRKNKAPMIIDLALSKTARGKIMVAKRDKTAIPEGWALDNTGKPTTDPEEALNGTMVPMGDSKGAALVLMVEILAAALTGSNFGFEASSFFEGQGESPGVGQLLLTFAPDALSSNQFYDKTEALFEAILEQDNTRLPGDRRLALRKKAADEGLAITENQYLELQELSSHA